MNKDDRIEFRVSKEVKAVLIKKAKANHMSMTEYMTQLIVNRPIDHKDIYEQLSKLVYEVNKIGVNINQIAHNINSGLIYPEEIFRMIEYMKELTERTENVRSLLYKERS